MRRPRKRLWTPPSRYETDAPSGILKESNIEKPLELTTKSSAFDSPHSAKVPKMECDKYTATASNEPGESSKFGLSAGNTETSATEPSAASLPPSDLVVPPIPPLWYPPLYPPYGIDPLHFFIDLRVSGQIYDRNKKEADAASSGQMGKIRHGHGSAFTVPPKRDKSPLALNLTATMPNKPSAMDFFNNNHNNNSNNNNSNNINSNDIDDKNSVPHNNTNYVLQNLPRIYTSMTGDDRQSLHSEESDCKSGSDIDVKDNDISNQSDDVVIVDDKQYIGAGIGKHALFSG